MELSPGQRSLVIRALAQYCLNIDAKPKRRGLYDKMALKLSVRYPRFGMSRSQIRASISMRVRNQRRLANKAEVPNAESSLIIGPMKELNFESQVAEALQPINDDVS